MQGRKINLTKKFRCVNYTPKDKSQENSCDLSLPCICHPATSQFSASSSSGDRLRFSHQYISTTSSSSKA